MQFRKALTLAWVAIYGALAAPAEEITTQVGQTDAEAQPPPSNNTQIDDWHEEPWTKHPLNKIMDKLFPVDMEKVHMDHNDIVTPSLPSDINIPTPFFPTSDGPTKKLYMSAIAAFTAEEAKTASQKEEDLRQKWIDVLDFNEKTICFHSTHILNLRCSDKRDAKQRRWRPKSFRKRYYALKNKLIDEMRVEGLVNLGRELQKYLDETGLTIEEPVSG